MNRNAIVTGGSGGIGRAVAQRLSRDGFAVAVSFSGNASNAEQAVSEIDAAGGKGVVIKADVASAGEVDALFKQAADKLGAIEVVVHCAGIMPLRPIAENDVAQMNAQGCCGRLTGVISRILHSGALAAAWFPKGPSASPFMLSSLLSELGGSGLHSAAKNATAAPLLAVTED
jgi:NAD(P)-dependent dehydrogenase (short-subunit alcohol dehydrogenase family)